MLDVVDHLDALPDRRARLRVEANQTPSIVATETIRSVLPPTFAV